MGENKAATEQNPEKRGSQDKGTEEVAQPAQFGTLTSGDKTQEGKPRNLELLLDLQLSVSVELARKEMMIKDILQLGQGSIIDFEKLAGEPVDLLVNNKKLAEGEVVVVDDRFGIRITKLVDTVERIKGLGER